MSRHQRTHCARCFEAERQQLMRESRPRACQVARQSGVSGGEQEQLYGCGPEGGPPVRRCGSDLGKPVQ